MIDGTVLALIPSPSQGVWHLGPVPIRAYALCIIVGIVVAVWWGSRRWQARGGQPGEVIDVALWAVPFGLVGGRLYHVFTDWETYFGPGGKGLGAAFRVWDGGLGIWGAVALGAVGAWIGARNMGIKLPPFGDAIAPAILLAQAIGRLGNYFNQELFGRPTDVPWGLEIFDRVNSDGQISYKLIDGVSTGNVATVVHPTFLYEMIWNVLIVALLVLIDRRGRIGHGRLFAMYVAGYCVGRFGVELMRDDFATHIFGIRINIFTAAIVFLCAALYVVMAPKGREQGLSMYWPDRAEELAEEGVVGYISPEIPDDETVDETVTGDEQVTGDETIGDDRPDDDQPDDSEDFADEDFADGDFAADGSAEGDLVDEEFADTEPAGEEFGGENIGREELDEQDPADVALIEGAAAAVVAPAAELDETGVDETGLNETGVDETRLNETEVDEVDEVAEVDETGKADEVEASQAAADDPADATGDGADAGADDDPVAGDTAPVPTDPADVATEAPGVADDTAQDVPDDDVNPTDSVAHITVAAGEDGATEESADDTAELTEDPAERPEETADQAEETTAASATEPVADPPVDEPAGRVIPGREPSIVDSVSSQGYTIVPADDEELGGISIVEENPGGSAGSIEIRRADSADAAAPEASDESRSAEVADEGDTPKEDR